MYKITIQELLNIAEEIHGEIGPAYRARLEETLKLKTQLAIVERLEAIAKALDSRNSAEEFRDNVNLYKV